MHSRELLSVPTLRVDCMCVYVVYMYVQYVLHAFYICVCVYQSELLLDIIHALVCVCPFLHTEVYMMYIVIVSVLYYICIGWMSQVG